DELDRVLAGFFDDGGVAEHVGDAEGGEAVLAGAKQVAGAAELEVDFGEAEAVGGFGEGVQSLCSIVGLRDGEDAGEAGVAAAADAAAELVELGEAEAFASFDGHEGGVGDVDADFDDTG